MKNYMHFLTILSVFMLSIGSMGARNGVETSLGEDWHFIGDDTRIVSFPEDHTDIEVDRLLSDEGEEELLPIVGELAFEEESEDEPDISEEEFKVIQHVGPKKHVIMEEYKGREEQLENPIN